MKSNTKDFLRSFRRLKHAYVRTHPLFLTMGLALLCGLTSFPHKALANSHLLPSTGGLAAFSLPLPSKTDSMQTQASPVPTKGGVKRFTTPALQAYVGKQLFYWHTMGEPKKGRVLLLGGGPGFTSWNLEPIQAMLSQSGYQVALMDMAGLGENSHLSAQPLFDQWIAQIRSVLHRPSFRDQDDRLPSVPTFLIGHSWGALMAMIYVRAYPRDIDRIVLLNPVDPEKKGLRQVALDVHERTLKENPPDDESLWHNTPNLPSDNSLPMETIALNQIRQVLPAYFYRYEEGKLYSRQFEAQDFQTHINVAAWKAYDLNPIRYREAKKWPVSWAFLDCRDDLLMPANWRALQSHLSFDRKAFLQKCNHFPWVERPEVFKKALLTLLPLPIKNTQE